MKKLLIIAIAAFAFTACGDSAKVEMSHDDSVSKGLISKEEAPSEPKMEEVKTTGDSTQSDTAK